MATAFGARAFGTALVVNLDSTDFWSEGPEWAFSDQCLVIEVDYQSGSKRYRWQTQSAKLLDLSAVGAQCL
jgi:hypothetical protein